MLFYLLAYCLHFKDCINRRTPFENHIALVRLFSFAVFIFVGLGVVGHVSVTHGDKHFKIGELLCVRADMIMKYISYVS